MTSAWTDNIDSFPIDLQQYCELIAIWKEDATVAGSQTFLKAASVAPPEDESAFVPPEIDPGDGRAILVIPDSRGRIRTWHRLRSTSLLAPFCGPVLKVNAPGLSPLPQTEAYRLHHRRRGPCGPEDGPGGAVLSLCRKSGASGLRGGILNGLLLRQGLVNEVSVLIYPCLAWGETTSSIFRAPDLRPPRMRPPGQGAEGTISLKLMQAR